MDPYLIFEDDIFLVFYKPPYYVMDTSNPTYDKLSKNKIDNLFTKKIKPFHVFVKKYLIEKYNIHPKYPSYGCCQRLDINTSGMILVSKENKNFTLCRNIINDKKNTIKIYLCLVNGLLDEKNGYIVNNIICKKKKSICNTVNFNLHSKDSKPSCSYYFVLKEYFFEGKYYSLVCIRIFTGRTHQIRLHMKSLNNYLVSDDKYCPKQLYKDNLKIIKRLFLHNFILIFFYNKEYKFKLKLPDDLKNVLKKMKVIMKYKFDYNIFKKKCNQLNFTPFDI
jgi:23S rRNA-/tRNA-specific pseudouridylate synthase